ncbi:MAG: hypothetical protein K0Q79_1335 [Flavipsychrobacter sp.]|jgi:hypothetical protein|nr:hypothetical protein [Flavipsychrobacter sp.]
MNATIGVYDNHDLAVDAVAKLKDGGYPVSHLSIMGLAETEEIDDKMHIMPKSPIKTAGIGAGTILGTTLGILTGVGMFAIPGVGVLYGAGALVGAIAGFDIGLIGGGLASALATIGIKDGNEKKYHDALVAGKYLVIAHGSKDIVEKAQNMLHEHGTHEEIHSH